MSDASLPREVDSRMLSAEDTCSEAECSYTRDGILEIRQGKFINYIRLSSSQISDLYDFIKRNHYGEEDNYE